MATTKYCPDCGDPAKIQKSNNCKDVINFWDCLFGKDRWKDLYKKRGDVCEEAGKIQRITTQKVLSKPANHTATAANKPKKSEHQSKKVKTIFHREVYSLEIEPTNLLRYVWPWKIKDRKVENNTEMKRNVQEERTNQNESDKNKKRLVKRRIRREQGVMLEGNTNNDGVEVRRMQTDSIGRCQGEYSRKMSHSRANENDHIFPPSSTSDSIGKCQGEYSKKMSHSRANENDHIFPPPNYSSPMRRVPSPTFITAQLTDLSIKIDQLENKIIDLGSEKQSNLNEQGVGHKNVRIPGKKKIGNNTNKQGRNNTRQVNGRYVKRILNGRNNTKNKRQFLKVEEKITKVERNDTQSFRNVTKTPKYTIRRSESNPSLLKIHAAKYSKCHKNNIDACILIHTQKKDVCVHGRYLDIKQHQSWWDQVKNIFSVSFIDRVFYGNTEKKNEDNNYRTKLVSNTTTCVNTESSDDNDSFHSFEEYDLGEELNSNFLNIRKSASYTILNNRSMVMADHDHNKKQKTPVENTFYKKMDVLDHEGIFRGNTSELIDENSHSNNENPVESTENGNKAVENSEKNHSMSFHNMLGEIYLSKKYKFLHESIQRDCFDEPNSYSMNKDRQSNDNKHFEMELWNNENLRQNRDVLCHEENIELEYRNIYGIGTSKNKTETPKKGVMTFTKILHSAFKSENSRTEYEEKLTKTMKSECSHIFKDSSFLKQFTKDGFYSFFPFSKKELQNKEENSTVTPNLAGTRVYQVYEFGELLR